MVRVGIEDSAGSAFRIREQTALRLTPTSGGCEGRTSRLRFVTAGLFFRLKRGAFAPLRRFRLRRETPGQ
jgi:hypothetical protein